MEKKIVLTLSAVIAASLVGCSPLEERLAEKIWQDAGIEQDAEYKAYQEMVEKGQLDENGVYNAESEWAAQEEQNAAPGEEPAGSIHVTFAVNPNVGVAYYKDAEFTEPIDTKNCYINPGDVIYAPAPQVANPTGSNYSFKQLEAWEAGENTNAEMIAAGQLEGDRIALQIPVGYLGTELSIRPVGQYTERILRFSDYYLSSEDMGTPRELGGEWTVNGEPVRGESQSISPIEPYRVRYKYNAEDFYFVSSEPACFFHEETGDASGEVEFVEAQACDETEQYTVELHRYISITVTNEASNIINGAISTISGTNDIIKSIEINGTEHDVKADKVQYLENLKCGDVIELVVGPEYKVIFGGYMEEESAERPDQRTYAITVPDTQETQLGISIRHQDQTTSGGFVPQTMPNAVVTVTDGEGNALKPGQAVSDSAKVNVTITAEPGYYITGKGVKNDIYSKSMSYKEYVDKIDTILAEHPAAKIYYATLDMSDDYGECEYKLDGKKVSGEVALRAGQKLTLTYTITDENYKLKGTKSDLFSAITRADKKTSVDIEITDELDGKTIKRETYIEIEKK